MNILGRHGGKAKSEVKAGFNVDAQAIKRLDKELAAVRDTAKSLADELQRAADASGSLSGNAPGGTPKAQNGTPQFKNTSPGAPGGGLRSMVGPGGLGGIATQVGEVFGGGKGMGYTMLGIGAAGFLGKQAVTSIDQRIDRNRGYALTADRLSVDTQLRTGMTQEQVMKYRQQLIGGRGDRNVNVDPNVLLGFENMTGISAAQQRQSVGAVRALSGYSMSTGDVLGTMQQNLNPAVANRQFNMMGGLSMYGPGGNPRDYMSLLNARVSMFQLDDRNISKGALREGSISRYRMDMMGIQKDEQDLLINLGQAQATFREKGGKGRFDPSSEEHRRLAGVEDNFATQFDETERLKGKREEDMYRRQADNYAALERSNQKLIAALGWVEDALSGFLGARTSTRNFMDIGGRWLQGAGVAAMFTPLSPVVGAGMIAAGGMLASGDPPDGGSGTAGASGSKMSSSSVNDHQIMVPFGYKGNGPGPRRPLSEVKEASIFKKMDPMMKERLLTMMRDNPNVGIGGGFRDTEEQKNEFLRRHVETTEGNHDRVWNGKFWRLVKGAPFAPPGSSMHEIGLAADLVGDIDWMNKNASRYGLKHFAGVNNEPWHVQPLELPNSRREYEKGGGATFLNEEEATIARGDGHGTVDGRARGPGGGGGGATQDFTGKSISQIVEAYLGMGPRGSANKSGIGNTSQTSHGEGDGSEVPDSYVSSGAMAAARAAYAAGFRDEDLSKIVAIAGRESNWRNVKSKVSDDWGMWQINGINRKVFQSMGYEKQDLLDPFKNAQVAYALYKQSGFDPWRASDNSSLAVVQDATGGKGFDPNGNPMWNTGKFQAEASVAANTVMTNGGDPPDTKPTNYVRRSAPRVTSPSMGGGAVSVTNQYQIDFSPVFKFDGAPQTPQLQQVAREAANYLRDQVDLAMKRSE